MWKKKLEDLLNFEKEFHPEARIEDYYKIVFQSIFGPGHLVKDYKQMFHFLEEEWDVVIPDESFPFVQDISINVPVFRLSLQKCKAEAVSLQLIADVFFQGSSRFQNPLQEKFPEILVDLAEILVDSKFGFTQGEIEQVLPLNQGSDFPLKHHSWVYRDLYHPHYRVILGSLLHACIA